MESKPLSGDARAIFERAIELPDAEREAFLEASCGQDREMRAAIQELLRAHAQAGQFLSNPDFFAATNLARDPLMGTVIGRYAILGILGEGGHGTVYLAEQEPPLRRHVALKVIKPGMDSQHVIARFARERQALAMMNHPHIAGVFDAGSTGEGLPYFVMELVDGVPITEFCRIYEVNLETRLNLFLEVCSAIEHAHEKNIIHRDLKPANVLVVLQGGKPFSKVIDFGISKALLPDTPDAAAATLSLPATSEWQFIGTPQYMSPEQAGGTKHPVDWRSDIYSLGALLYELLAGRPPFDRSQFENVAQIGAVLREETPMAPSDRLVSGEPLPPQFSDLFAERQKRAAEIRGSLDCIVAKALQKNPLERYQSAAALASAVESYLQQRGKSPGISQRALRFRDTLVRRRREIALAVVCLALGLLAGLGLKLRPLASSSTSTTLPVFASAAPQAPTVWTMFDRGDAQLAILADGVHCFSTTAPRFQHLPPEVTGAMFTRRPYNTKATVDVDAAAGATVFILTDSDADPSRGAIDLQHQLIRDGWKRLADAKYHFKHSYPLAVYERTFDARQRFTLNGEAHAGIIIAAKNLKLIQQSLNEEAPSPTSETREE